MRRHHERSGLRLILAHPCGGQARQLWVMQDNPTTDAATVFFDSLLGLSFSDGCAHRLGGAPSTEPACSADDYISDLLSAGDPKGIIDRIERCAGLAPTMGPLPPSTPAILVARIISRLTAAFSFSRVSIDAECGWIDSAGYSSGIDDRLRQFPWIATDVPWSDPCGSWPTQARATSKYWLLGPISEAGHEARLVLSMDGRCAGVDNPDDPVDLWAKFEESERDLQAVASQLIIMLGVSP